MKPKPEETEVTEVAVVVNSQIFYGLDGHTFAHVVTELVPYVKYRLFHVVSRILVI